MGDDVSSERRADTTAHRGPDRLVGVYPDEETARRAAEAAEAGGAADVRIEAEGDRVSALRGEMREEVEHSWGGPSIAMYTEEMAKNVPVWTAAGTAVGILVALPFAFIGFGDLSLLLRLIVAAVSGAFFGGTIGFLVGGGFFDVRRKSRERIAAERGVVVGATVPHDRDGAAAGMANHNPIRVDRVTPTGEPEDTVTTEEESGGDTGPRR